MAIVFTWHCAIWYIVMTKINLLFLSLFSLFLIFHIVLFSSYHKPHVFMAYMVHAWCMHGARHLYGMHGARHLYGMHGARHLYDMHGVPTSDRQKCTTLNIFYHSYNGPPWWNILVSLSVFLFICSPLPSLSSSFYLFSLSPLPLCSILSLSLNSIT